MQSDVEKEQSEGDKKAKFAQKIASLQFRFVDKVASRVVELTENIEASNWVDIHDFGHKIKGTSACLSLSRFTEIGKEIQEAAMEKNYDKLLELVERFRSEGDDWKTANDVVTDQAS